MGIIFHLWIINYSNCQLCEYSICNNSKKRPNCICTCDRVFSELYRLRDLAIVMNKQRETSDSLLRSALGQIDFANPRNVRGILCAAFSHEFGGHAIGV